MKPWHTRVAAPIHRPLELFPDLTPSQCVVGTFTDTLRAPVSTCTYPAQAVSRAPRPAVRDGFEQYFRVYT